MFSLFYSLLCQPLIACWKMQKSEQAKSLRGDLSVTFLPATQTEIAEPRSGQLVSVPRLTLAVRRGMHQAKPVSLMTFHFIPRSAQSRTTASEHIFG